MSEKMPPLDGGLCNALAAMLQAGVPLETARDILRPMAEAAHARRLEAERERLRAREEERRQLAEVSGCDVSDLTYAGDGMWRTS